jgi:hypothetical protein
MGQLVMQPRTGQLPGSHPAFQPPMIGYSTANPPNTHARELLAGDERADTHGSRSDG